MRTANKNKSIPVDIIDFSPYFSINFPVTKEGANIANAWAETTLAAWLVPNPHPTIAIGEEVIIRFITPYAIIEQTIETKITGLFKIVTSGLFKFALFELALSFILPPDDFDGGIGLT